KLVSLVVEKAEQLNEIGDLFTLVKPAPEHRLIGNVRAPKDRLVDLHLRHRTKQQRDVAIFQLGRRALERQNAPCDLLRIEHARILFGAWIVFERRLRRNQKLNQRPFVSQLALCIALLVFDVAQLVQVLVFTRWNVIRNLKQASKEVVEKRDQRLLAAKVELQRLLFAAGREQRRRHLAKSVDRLLAVADDEEVRRSATLRECESFE